MFVKDISAIQCQNVTWLTGKSFPQYIVEKSVLEQQTKHMLLEFGFYLWSCLCVCHKARLKCKFLCPGSVIESVNMHTGLEKQVECVLSAKVAQPCLQNPDTLCWRRCRDWGQTDSKYNRKKGEEDTMSTASDQVTNYYVPEQHLEDHIKHWSLSNFWAESMWGQP